MFLFRFGLEWYLEYEGIMVDIEEELLAMHDDHDDYYYIGSQQTANFDSQSTM